MKLKCFRITNYKSILDSGVCYLNPELTIFAGKNESGKTNILTGIQHLSLGEFKVQDYPLRKSEYKPKVYYEFSLEKEDYDNLNASMDNLLKENKIKSDTFAFLLDEHGFIQLDSDNLIVKLQNKIDTDFQAKLALINRNLKKVALDKEVGDLESVVECLNELKNIEFDNKEKIIELLNDAIRNGNAITDETINSAVQSILPKIVYFNSFKDNLPDVITKDCFNPNNSHFTIVSRLFKYLNIDPNKIFFEIQSEEDDRKRADYLKSLEKILSDDLFEKYKQKPIRLRFRMSSLGGLNIEIYDADAKGFIHQGDLAYKISDRSEGFRWFLSFYITLKGEQFSKNDIILIDEPGLYLHAAAQKDMLNVFLEESKTHQMIFTTHSPYLIDVNNLSRIRLVEKHKSKLGDINFEESKIVSSILKGADNETITPIADAIGYNLSEGLTLNMEYMSIVEGPSDYYYITKMATIIGKPINSNLIPAGGASKIGNICAVLFGFKVRNITCVYDNDEAGNAAIDQNKSNLDFENVRHIFVSENSNYQIEDMFSIGDFSRHICDNPKSIRNSKLVEKMNKTLLAKVFSNKILSLDEFSDETINNFSSLIALMNNEKDD